MNTKPAPSSEPLSKERLRLWLRLLKASGLIEEELRRRLRREFESTLPRFDVMAALSRYPDGLKMSELSELLRVSNGNVTGIVQKLVEDGQALRVAVPGDRRAALVRLTPRGRETFATQAAAHEGWVSELMGDLGEAEIAALSAQLGHLTQSLEKGE